MRDRASASASLFLFVAISLKKSQRTETHFDSRSKKKSKLTLCKIEVSLAAFLLGFVGAITEPKCSAFEKLKLKLMSCVSFENLQAKPGKAISESFVSSSLLRTDASWNVSWTARFSSLFLHPLCAQPVSHIVRVMHGHATATSTLPSHRSQLMSPQPPKGKTSGTQDALRTARWQCEAIAICPQKTKKEETLYYILSYNYINIYI